MIKEMYNKDPITNPNSRPEGNMIERSTEKARRVEGYMNSKGLLSHLEQRLVDTTSDITCNRKKEEIEFNRKNLLKQGFAVNDGKKHYLKNSHLIEGKNGYYA
jgi:hypothetical protein